jgi:hypothetical protein
MKDPYDKARQAATATRSSRDIYLAHHSPAKRIGTVEAVDKNVVIEEAAELFKAHDPRKLIAVQR